jgi:ADP-heptose:LPS heptosyltransferase
VKVYEDEDLNWLRLPRQTMVDRIFDRQYEAVVDMHPAFNLPSAYLTHISGAPLRIGFASKYSEHFFNVEIDSSKSEFLERSYLAVQKLLNL